MSETSEEIAITSNDTRTENSQPNFVQIKEELLDPHKISKKYDAEGRKTTAQEISGNRTLEQFTQKEFQEANQQTSTTDEQIAGKKAEIDQKFSERTQRLNSRLVKIKSLLGFKDQKALDLQKELNALNNENNELIWQFVKLGEQVELLRKKQTESPTAENNKKILEAYYEKVKDTPLTQEEKRSFLKPEFLASLSTEEYIALWRRLNPYFLSHVTRQGFRDHNAMIYHSGGMEKYHNGFVSVTEDGKLLRPPLALQGLRVRNEASVKEFLSDWVLQAEDEQTARERFDDLIHFSLASAPKYPDKTAVHFATQLVADSYYGGEANNEVFFVFPSDAIASQHSFAFNGWEKDFTKPQSETKWNDVFVWPEAKNNPGITTDAGFVFLPEKTPVDPATGSKYDSEVKTIDGQEQRVMVEDAKLVDSLVAWGKNLDAESPLNKLFTEYEQERNYYQKMEMERICLTAFSRELQKLGVDADIAGSLGFQIMQSLALNRILDDENLQDLIRNTGANWKRAENPIPAKTYWEAYFAKNPELRPKHVHYYDGYPTNAILEFQQKNGIGKADTSASEGKLLGFDDHCITNMRDNPKANKGHNELMELGNKIIEEHFRSRHI